MVFEVTSKTTRREDQIGKMRLYAQLGVQEYYLYDPTADYLDPPLAGYQLVGGGYVPMQPQNQELLLGEMAFTPEAGEPPEYVSPLLGLHLALDEHNILRFYDGATGQRLLTDEEARQNAEVQALLAENEARLAENEARLAENQARLAENQARLAENQARLAEQRADYAVAQAATAEERAAQAEAENARLREELARLQGKRA